MELDIENFDALRQYLTERGDIHVGQEVSFEKLLGGVSNRTVRVSYANGRSWILKQALAKLRVSVDWFSRPERIAVEAAGLRWLNSWAPPGSTPLFIFEDGINHVMAMEAVPEEHENWKSVLLKGQIVSDHFKQFGLLLGTIHRRSSELKEEVSEKFANTAHFESLRLDPYYLYAAQTAPAAASFLNTLAKDALLHKLSLVHGDFSPKNTLIYRGKLILLDYEVMHFGEPAFDTGFALAHFLSKAHHLPEVRARLADAASLFWRTYRNELSTLEWADALEPRAVQHLLGCLLARVAGKSPLEYLAKDELARQRDIVLWLIDKPPNTIDDLITEFVRKLETHAKD
jgi:5-methylthioribose kinase